MSEVLESEVRYGRRFGRADLVGDYDEDKPPSKPGKIGRLMEQAWSHACTVPLEMAQVHGIDWTIHRYGECNFWTKVIWETVWKYNQKLCNTLMSNTKRLPDMLGPFHQSLVPDNYPSTFSPLSTPWGYGLSRVLIEKIGRDENRSQERVVKAIDILEQVAFDSNEVTDPKEFLVALGEGVVQPEIDSDGQRYVDVDCISVLPHILSQEIMDESKCVNWYREIEQIMYAKAPTLWHTYSQLSERVKKESGIAVL
jgi:hypothetical protein